MCVRERGRRDREGRESRHGRFVASEGEKEGNPRGAAHRIIIIMCARNLGEPCAGRQAPDKLTNANANALARPTGARRVAARRHGHRRHRAALSSDPAIRCFCWVQRPERGDRTTERACAPGAPRGRPHPPTRAGPGMCACAAVSRGRRPEKLSDRC